MDKSYIKINKYILCIHQNYILQSEKNKETVEKETISLLILENLEKIISSLK